MEAIVALILAGMIFRTAGTWPSLRLLCLFAVVYAIALDFVPHAWVVLRPFNMWVWVSMFVLWLVNVTSVRRSGA